MSAVTGLPYEDRLGLAIEALILREADRDGPLTGDDVLDVVAAHTVSVIPVDGSDWDRSDHDRLVEDLCAAATPV